MRSKSESGMALVETILLSLLLLVPLLWALGVLADVHRGALATTAAAREGAIAAARANSFGEAVGALEESVAYTFADHGLDVDSARLKSSIPRDVVRGSLVEVEVAYPVTVLQAPFLGRVAGPSVVVRAVNVVRIDPYRSRS
jgi:hypothetical protein